MEHIILLSGKQGSGKTTLAQRLRADLAMEGYLVYALKYADPLYEMHWEVLKIAQKYGFPVKDMKKDGRLLQVLGTEWGREIFGRDIWVEATKKRIQSLILENPGAAKYAFIVEDCRFYNEVTAFPESFKVRLECAEETRRQRAVSWRPDTSHSSEVDLDSFSSFDLVADTSRVNESELAALVVREFHRWLNA